MARKRVQVRRPKLVPDRIYWSSDYDLLISPVGNRAVNLAKREPLKKMMQAHGFARSKPITVRENYEITDGQHRLECARLLGIEYAYTLDDSNMGITDINNTARPWSIEDYAHSYIDKGNPDYIVAMNFAGGYGVSITAAVSLLTGNTNYNGGEVTKFKMGTFKVTDADFAERVAELHLDLREISRHTHGRNFIFAIAACVRLPFFNPERLVRNSRGVPEKLDRKATTKSYLEAFEDIYNYRIQQRNRVDLVLEVQRNLRKK